jgi:uncharacterized protein
MNRVLVDTGGFYAALNRRDASHRDAARLFRRARRDHWFLFTTNFVLAESHALILARMGGTGPGIFCRRSSPEAPTSSARKRRTNGGPER